MFTAEYAENAEIFLEIRLGALCALGGETRCHLLLYHYRLQKLDIGRRIYRVEWP